MKMKTSLKCKMYGASVIHDPNTRRILGLVAKARHKVIGDLHIAKVVSRYSIKKISNAYTFSTFDPGWVDDVCKLNRISQVDGYIPLNFPIDLMNKYNFTSWRNIDSEFGFKIGCDTNINTFMHYINTCDHPDHLGQLRNLSAFVSNKNDKARRMIAAIPSGYGSRNFISNYLKKHGFHILCKIPKGCIILNASDHWYHKQPLSLPNPYDINIVIALNEASLQENPIDYYYKEGLKDALSKMLKKSRICVDVNIRATEFSEKFRISLPILHDKYRDKYCDKYRDKYHDKYSDKYVDHSNPNHPEQSSERTIFTDASIISRKGKSTAGIGIWSDDYDIKECCKLDMMGNPNNINQAELYAIFVAMLHVHKVQIKADKTNEKLVIYTDSLSAIKLLRGDIYCEKYGSLIRSIKRVIDAFPGKVTIKKVKAHSGVVGNENADFLARYAATISSS